MSGVAVTTDPLMFRVRAVEVPCVLNIAAVKLRFKEFDEAIHECNKVLDIEVSQLSHPLNSSLMPRASNEPSQRFHSHGEVP